MIEPGELHRYFKVREIANGRDVWLIAVDTRYSVTEAETWGAYRIDPRGDHFLTRSAVESHPWGRPMRLYEVEPLPDGGGLYAVPDELQLSMTYSGSFRQMADQAAACCVTCGAAGDLQLGVTGLVCADAAACEDRFTLAAV